MALINQKAVDNWALALKDIAVSNQKVNAFIEQTGILIDLLKEYDDFVKVVSYRASLNEDRVDKVKIIDETFSQFGFELEILNVMKILAEGSVFEYARPIFKTTRKFLTDLERLEYGVAWSTTPLSTTELEAIQEKIAAIMKKNIILINKIDESLIGGVQVVVENKIFDGSIKGKLNELRYQVLTQKDTKEKVG